MSQKILITKFNYDMPHNEFRKVLLSVADDFARVPDCQWKIWLINEDKKEGGAVYLFDNEHALKTFTESPLVQSVLSHAALSNFDFRITDLVAEPNKITRAPIMEAVSG